MTSVSLSNLERLDRVARMIIAGDSQCYWFLSALLAQLKEDGYTPSNPALFDKSISSLSATLATQTGVASRMQLLLMVGARSSVVAAGVRLLPQPGARVFGGRSHAPVQPL